jgi:hypothetical protein
MPDTFRIEDDGPDGLTITFNAGDVPVQLDYDGTVSIVLRGTGERWEFYEAVDQALGDWYREGQRERRAYEQASDEERARVLGLDELDPSHPDYTKNLADLADIRRDQ